MTISITFPDGREVAYDKSITGFEIAENISKRLAKEALAIKVNGKVQELNRPIQEDASVAILTWKDKEGKAAFWHSSAHLLAEALEAIYKDVKFGIGPPIENGFYYDIDLGDRVLKEEDFEKIEAKMKSLAAEKNSFQRTEISKDEAIAFYKEKNDPYKLELLQDLQDGEITFYKQGNFTDLCRGPHIPDTGKIKAIKLLNVAGAYWRGDESRKQLTRIYGVSFPKQKELTQHLEMLEEAKKRDHRKLGKALKLFTFSEEVGAGLPLWLPKGAVLREQLIQFMRKAQVKAGYDPVVSPHIGAKQLYVTSGHYDKYGEDSFHPITTPKDGEEYFLKPMNCPHHCEIYKSEPRSYKDLPVRFAEFGTVYRYEQSGELHGITRVRGFTQDDAHIFTTPDQLKEEFVKVIDLVLYIFEKLDFKNYKAQISLRDQEDRSKYIGDETNWEKAEDALLSATKNRNLETVVEYGEAAFYGPKLDFMVRDALGREWQLGTIQIDYNLPERFDLEYTGEDNQKHRPVMIHRAPFGSLERFIGVLIEHCAGNFPTWLAPTQVAILPITDKVNDFAQKVVKALSKAEVRTHFDNRSEKIGRKIRDAEVEKIPYMLIIGEKEMEGGLVSVRRHQEGDLGTLSVEDFMAKLSEEITFD